MSKKLSMMGLNNEGVFIVRQSMLLGSDRPKSLLHLFQGCITKDEHPGTTLAGLSKACFLRLFIHSDSHLLPFVCLPVPCLHKDHLHCLHKPVPLESARTKGRHSGFPG